MPPTSVCIILLLFGEIAWEEKREDLMGLEKVSACVWVYRCVWVWVVFVCVDRYGQLADVGENSGCSDGGSQI